MDTSKATARPWVVRTPRPARFPEYRIETKGGQYVASVQITANNPALDDAALIVRAVNSHEALVAALRETITKLDFVEAVLNGCAVPSGQPDVSRAFADIRGVLRVDPGKARAALALAEQG